jgi:FKBP12-rapamycin complex-associated protein
MLARYREVCDTVLRFRDSKEKLIRRAVITLVPRLAAFAPERFVKSYLKQATEYLLAVLAVPAERGAGFTALAEMASALARAGVACRMKAPDDFLRPIAGQIKECLGQRSRGRPPCPEALECAGVLALALRQDWQPYMLTLLEPMFQTGLSGGCGWVNVWWESGWGANSGGTAASYMQAAPISNVLDVL